MKLQKNKIVMVLILVSVVLFIVGYSVITFGKKEEESLKDKQPPVPEIGEGQKQYESKIEALEDLEEERQTNAPQVYDESLFDSNGVYRDDLAEMEKKRLIDSLYIRGNQSSTTSRLGDREDKNYDKSNTSELEVEQIENLKERGLEHQLFFAANGVNTPLEMKGRTDKLIPVSVDGQQKISTNERLSLRLLNKSWIAGRQFPKNTPVYAQVSFGPNRTLLEIHHIQEKEVNLKAYDLQDGAEGIYLKNSFRQQATREVVDQTVGSINIPTLPQVSGLKNLFRKNNRNVKVIISDQYQLNLKPVTR